MDLQSSLKKRRMVRAYQDRPLPEGMIDAICDSARRSPSAGNTQAVSFVVLDSPQLTNRYWDCTLPRPRRSSFSFPDLLKAPAIVLLCVNPGKYLRRYSEDDKLSTGRGESSEQWPVPFWWVDSGAVMQNLLLLCTEASLGACTIGVFDHENAVKRTFNIPYQQRIVAAITVGFPAPDRPGRSANRPKPAIEQILRRPSD